MSDRHTIRYPKSLFTQLSDAAGDSGVNLSAFVREILLVHLNAKPTTSRVQPDTDAAELDIDLALRFIDRLSCEVAWLEVHYDLLHDELQYKTRQLSDLLDQTSDLEGEHHQDGMASIRSLVDSIREEIACATRVPLAPSSADEKVMFEIFDQRCSDRIAAGELVSLQRLTRD